MMGDQGFNWKKMPPAMRKQYAALKAEMDAEHLREAIARETMMSWMRMQAGKRLGFKAILNASPSQSALAIAEMSASVR